MSMAQADDPAAATSHYAARQNWPSPCNHGEKLTYTVAATPEARTGRSGFPLRRNDLHGKFWLPLRSNVEKPTCTVAANTTQRELVTSLPLVVCMSGIGRSGSPPLHPLTMFHVTNRPRQGADEAGKRRDKKPTIGG